MTDVMDTNSHLLFAREVDSEEEVVRDTNSQSLVPRREVEIILEMRLFLTTGPPNRGKGEETLTILRDGPPITGEVPHPHRQQRNPSST